MKKNSKKVLILASGGIDSTACIQFYKKLKFNVDILFVDYGQAGRLKEFKAIKAISKFYKINLKKLIIKNNPTFGDGVIIGRNAFLLFAALMNFKTTHGIVACGVHFGTNYYDCSPKFIEQMQTIFDQYTEGTIKISAPFLKLNKKEIYTYCISEKAPLYLTYSCELGLKQPCAKCSTCKDLKAIYAS